MLECRISGLKADGMVNQHTHAHTCTCALCGSCGIDSKVMLDVYYSSMHIVQNQMALYNTCRVLHIYIRSCMHDNHAPYRVYSNCMHDQLFTT